MSVSFKATVRRGIILPKNQGETSVALSKLPRDVEVDVVVSVAGKKRSLKQNAFYWDCIVPAFEALGHERFSEWFEMNDMAPKDSAHNVIKAAFLDPIKIELPDGKVVEVLPSTSKLTTAQFAMMTERAERYLNNLDPPVYLPAKEQE